MSAGTLNLNSLSTPAAPAIINHLVLAGGVVENGVVSSPETFDLRAGTVSASLEGAGGVSKTTSGLATLAAANFYTGGTTISGGVLDITGPGTLGAAANSLTVSGAETFLDLGERHKRKAAAPPFREERFRTAN